MDEHIGVIVVCFLQTVNERISGAFTSLSFRFREWMGMAFDKVLQLLVAELRDGHFAFLALYSMSYALSCVRSNNEQEIQQFWGRQR